MTVHLRRHAKALGNAGEPVLAPAVWRCFCGAELHFADEDVAYESCGCEVLTGGSGSLDGMRIRMRRAVWRPETSADPLGWCGHRPSHGQGAVTALEVQRLCGGALLQTVNDGITHMWNQLPDGTEIDLTRDQFDEWSPCRPVVVRRRVEVLADPRTAGRYELVRRHLTPPYAA